MQLLRRPRQRQRGEQADEHEQVGAPRPVDDEQDHRAQQDDGGEAQAHHAHDPTPQRAVPGRRGGDHDAGQQDQAARELGHRDRDGEDDRGRSDDQGEHRRKPPAHRIRPS